MEDILEVLNALSNPTRLRIFLLLNEGDLCVCEFEDILDMKQSRISHALRRLSEAGLTSKIRDGRNIIYSINPEVLNTPLIKGLLNQLKISKEDLQKFKKCRKEKVREKCRT